jgi:hypothetical protein
MKKLLIVGAAVTGAAFLAKRFASSSGGPDFGRMVERMPENAPPKWISGTSTQSGRTRTASWNCSNARRGPPGVRSGGSCSPDTA